MIIYWQSQHRVSPGWCHSENEVGWVKCRKFSTCLPYSCILGKKEQQTLKQGVLCMPANPKKEPGARGEHPSTYVVQDRSNEDELLRLQLQDHLLTSAMGGVMPEEPPTPF